MQGTWDAGTTKTNKWYADGVEIVGATATGYTPTIEQIGQVLTYEVTSTRPGYTTVVKTSPGKTIVGLAQTLQPTPTISGTPQVGATLTGDPGIWDAGTAQAYQWLADGIAIESATGLTFDLTQAELGRKMTFRVSSTRPTYESVTKESAPTGTVAAGTLTVTGDPDITGAAAQVGVPLTAVTGTWDAGVTFTYQWTADGADLAGATGPTYTPVVADIGVVDRAEGHRAQARLHRRHQDVRPLDLPGPAGWPDGYADADHHRHPEGGRAADRGARDLGRRRGADLPVDRRRHRRRGRHRRRRTPPWWRTSARS